MTQNKATKKESSNKLAVRRHREKMTANGMKLIQAYVKHESTLLLTKIAKSNGQKRSQLTSEILENWLVNNITNKERA